MKKTLIAGFLLCCLSDAVSAAGAYQRGVAPRTLGGVHPRTALEHWSEECRPQALTVTTEEERERNIFSEIMQAVRGGNLSRIDALLSGETQWSSAWDWGVALPKGYLFSEQQFYDQLSSSAKAAKITGNLNYILILWNAYEMVQRVSTVAPTSSFVLTPMFVFEAFADNLEVETNDTQIVKNYEAWQAFSFKHNLVSDELNAKIGGFLDKYNNAKARLTK